MPTIDIHISSDCEKYELVFLLNKEDKPICCWFSFMNSKGYETESWDSEAYLEKLYNVVESYNNSRALIQEDYFDIVKDIPVQDFIEVEKLFNKAIDMGLWEKE